MEQSKNSTNQAFKNNFFLKKLLYNKPSTKHNKKDDHKNPTIINTFEK